MQLRSLCRSVRLQQVTLDYGGRPDESGKMLKFGGDWLRTGGMGFMDQRGYFKITDREENMIIVSGLKAFLKQIEDVVAMHPGVGEAVRMVVLRKAPALTEQALLAHCRQHLIDYKVLKTIEFHTEPLPKTSLGKILRRQRRDVPVSCVSLDYVATGF